MENNLNTELTYTSKTNQRGQTQMIDNEKSAKEDQSRGQTPLLGDASNPSGAYFVPYTALPKKEYSPLTKRENTFIFLIFIGVFLLVDFALFHGFSLGFTISYAIIFIISSIFIFDKASKNLAFSFICGALSLALCVTPALYNNSFIKPVSILIILALYTAYCIGISSGFSKNFGNYKMLLDLFFGIFVYPFENISNVFGSIKAGAKENKKGLSALLGILLALPVLIIIIPLLVISDAAFEGLIVSIGEHIGIYLLELAIAFIALPYAYSFLFSKKKKLGVDEKEAKSNIKKLPASACVSFLSVISLTYMVYLFSQLAYFFSAFKGLLPEGYTHSASAFARRGFYEMCIICAINIGLISLVSIFIERKNKKLPVAVKALSLFISLFSILLVVIAIQKMRLNIETYGLSRNRILVCAFMLMMLVVITFFILHIFAPKVKYMQYIIIICSVIFLALSFADIDAKIAEYNINAYTSGELQRLDVEAIAELSDSAVPYLVKLAKSDDKKIAKKAQKELSERTFLYSNLTLNEDETELVVYDDEKDDFRSFNRARVNAEKCVINYYSSLSDEEKEEYIF